MELVPLGDCAILIRIGETIDARTHATVRAVTAALENMRGVEVVPAYASVAVHYNPVLVSHARMEADLRACLENITPGAATPSRLVEIPVQYGGESGPDIEDVARHAGITTDEVVALHASGDYTVYMIGFAPGFPYLAGLAPQLAIPRLPAPRLRVPAGSVAIAGEQTGVYPIDSPGGWRIIGRTDTRLFDPASAEPTLLQVGDRVRFVAVD